MHILVSFLGFPYSVHFPAWLPNTRLKESNNNSNNNNDGMREIGTL